MEPRYTTDTSLELEDFRRYAKTMGSQPRGLLIALLVLMMLLYYGISNMRSGNTVMGLSMIGVVVLCPLVYMGTSRLQSKKFFERLKASGGNAYTVLFFDDHFETRSKNGQVVYAYQDLKGITSTRTDFYLEVGNGHSVIVQKKNCSEELLTFLYGLGR